jgi:TonB family protein
MRRWTKSFPIALIVAVVFCCFGASRSASAQVASTQDAAQPQRIRLGGQIHPLVKHRVEPKYPQEAISQGIEGDVQAMVSFGTDGVVAGVKILSGDKALADSVSTALSEWRYAPVQLNGKPVTVEAPITVTFKLKPKPSVSDNEHPVKGGETVPRQ